MTSAIAQQQRELGIRVALLVTAGLLARSFPRCGPPAWTRS
jgi:hypothetical protein